MLFQSVAPLLDWDEVLGSPEGPDTEVELRELDESPGIVAVDMCLVEVGVEVGMRFVEVEVRVFAEPRLHLGLFELSR
jgi:hypothetical protein